MKLMKNKNYFGLLVILFLCSNIAFMGQAQEQEPFFQLSVRLCSAGDALDYFYYIQEMLEEINIEIETEWILFNDFPSLILLNRDWDLLFSEIKGWDRPDMRQFYSSTGSLNMVLQFLPFCFASISLFHRN
ncbi:MAG: hypothetical protein KGD64_15360, partial [Candidatus Heimdallarchaeota archaeon]|nr:hypothetical protein [Candidatus Heimdallarchaeota archaeon]